MDAAKFSGNLRKAPVMLLPNTKCVDFDKDEGLLLTFALPDGNELSFWATINPQGAIVCDPKGERVQKISESELAQHFHTLRAIGMGPAILRELATGDKGR